MNIVLTCLVNFQEYIIINIEQLLKLNHNNIHVITNKQILYNFDNYKDKIKLYIVEDFERDLFKFNSTSTLNNFFRNGFWRLSSYRFFIIYEFMYKYNIENVIHLENDVLIYYNCDLLLPLLDKKKLYIPFDCFRRNIASIVFIPNHHIFEEILHNYNKNIDDMYNFRNIQLKTQLIENFPIFKLCNINEEYKFVTKNYDIFNMIFDGAAIGQYLGGIDPRNKTGNTKGFINETCIIKYNNYSFEWDDKKPFLILKNEKIPIFNLHIHSKNLKEFV